MSNIYILEPPTFGKVLLETTVGDIDIELWAKETPKACRNFVQLCMEGYYDGTIFHRVVKDFIVQGGDPTGSGMGGDSIYGAPFKDEFHSRLRFVRRGLVAMANAGKDDNGSQFFFTMSETSELQNKHTLFGKVTGNTVFNMLKLQEGIIDKNERPAYPNKIISTKILQNPFPDIIPRIVEKRSESKEEKKQSKSKMAATKNFSLLSFGEEAEEDEEEIDEVNKNFNTGKGKSSHDLANDPKLSSKSAHDSKKAVESNEHVDGDIKFEAEDLEPSEEVTKSIASTSKNSGLNLETVREKLKRKEPPKQRAPLDMSDEAVKKRKMDEIKAEIRSIKKDLRGSNNDSKEESSEEEEPVDETVAAYRREKAEIVEAKRAMILKKGASRELQALEYLSRFKQKISSAKELKPEKDEQLPDEGDDDGTNISWMNRPLHSVEEAPVLAKDASMKGDDWFEIYDPRNPINKRRRETGKDSKKK